MNAKTQVAEAPAVLTPIAEYTRTAAALADLASRYKGVVFDVATREGMLAAIKGRAEIRGYRVALEKTRVEIKAPALERARLIDTEAKRIKEALAELEDPIDETIKTEEGRKEREREAREAAELARVTGIQNRIALTAGVPAAYVGEKSDTIAAALEIMKAETAAPWAQEFQATAEAGIKTTIEALELMLAGTRAQEDAAAAEAARVTAERAELARLRAEQDERNRTEQARIAEETRKRVEEAAAARAKIEAEERTSREKIEQEERAARRAREEADAKAKAERELAEIEARRLQEEEAARLRAIRTEEERAWAEKEAADKAKRAAEEAEAARQAQAQAEEAARLRAEHDRQEAARREIEAQQQELLAIDRLLRVLRERITGLAPYKGIAKAIDVYLVAKAKETEKQAAA